MLKQLLPNVDRLLVIGWRAQEESFLELVSDAVKAEILGLIVSSDRAGAEPVVDTLRLVLPNSKLVASDRPGFSGFVAREDYVRGVWDGNA